MMCYCLNVHFQSPKVNVQGLHLFSSPWTYPRPIFNTSATYPDKRPSHYAVNVHCHHPR